MADNREYITAAGEKGDVNISEEVVAIIAASAANEVEGVVSLATSTKEIGKKHTARGVKVHFSEGSISINVNILVAFGNPVNEVGTKVQAAVSSAVESMTGFAVSEVNVQIFGVVMEKN